MTKKEIVKEIADRLGLTQLQTKEIVQLTFDSVIDTLLNSKDHRIELRNFGVFQVKRRAARSARNPRTDEKVTVPAKNVVTFKPGKRMQELVQKLENVRMMGEDDEDGELGDSSVVSIENQPHPTEQSNTNKPRPR